MQTQKVLSKQQETLAKVPWGTVNSPSLEIFKSHLDTVLDSWAQVARLLEQEGDLWEVPSNFNKSQILQRLFRLLQVT